MEKPAPAQHPIHGALARRWSPRAVSSRPVAPRVLASLFEAARWAPSCFNDQPWRYVLATKDEPVSFERLASLLVPGNAWAKEAYALALSTARLHFHHNGNPNVHAWHDVGAASALMAVEAVRHGVRMHQMGGFDRERARTELAIPEGWDPVAMIAIAYPGELSFLPEKQQAAERSPRERRPLADIVRCVEGGAPPGF